MPYPHFSTSHAFPQVLLKDSFLIRAYLLQNDSINQSVKYCKDKRWRDDGGEVEKDEIVVIYYRCEETYTFIVIVMPSKNWHETNDGTKKPAETNDAFEKKKLNS